MRIESFDSIDTKTGMREISSRYGGDVLIISNSRLDGKNRFVIAVDKEREGKPEEIDNFEEQVKDIFSSKIQEVKKSLTEENENLSSAKELIEYIRVEFDRIRSGFNAQNNNYDRSGQISLEEILGSSSIPVRFLRRLENVVENCTSKKDVLNELGKYFQDHIPSMARLPNTPALHILMGSHGAGKTLCAVRLAWHITSTYKHQAIAVSYKPGKNGSWAHMQLLGSKLGIEVYRAAEISSLLAIISENMQSSSIIIEISSNVDAKEISEFQNDFPFAHFHLVLPKDGYSDIFSSQMEKSAPYFSSILATRLDRQGTYWPLLDTITDKKIPLLFGSVSEDVTVPFVEIDKDFLIREAFPDVSLKKQK